MKSYKRYIALLLAVVLIGGAQITFRETALLATDDTSVNQEETQIDTQDVRDVEEITTVEEVSQTAGDESATVADTTEESATAPDEDVQEIVLPKQSDLAEEVQVEPDTTAVEESTPETTESVPEAEKTAPEADTTAPEAEQSAPAPDESETEPVMPAALFSDTSSNGLEVYVSAPEGAFPEGTTMTLQAVSKQDALQAVVDNTSEDKNYVDACAVDITFQDSEGNEIQPQTAINVSITGADVTGEEQEVYHIPDSGEAEFVTDLAASTGTTFSAESFSIYVIVGIETGTQENNTIVSGSTYTMNVGDVLRFSVTEGSVHEWSVTSEDGQESQSAVVTVGGEKNTVLTVNAVKAEKKVKITHFWNDKKNLEFIYLDIVKKGSDYTVSFDSDGGSKQVDSILVDSATENEDEKTITLPDAPGIQNNKEFVGWSLTKNQTGVGAGSYKGKVYAPGDKYTVTSNVTFYATWADLNEDATFYIYKAKQEMPAEPSGHVDAWFESVVTIEGVVKTAKYIYDPTGEAVLANLNETPTDEQIDRAMKKNGGFYDPQTERIVWYVIKNESGIHVDGTILQKNGYTLTYDKNCDAVNGVTPNAIVNIESGTDVTVDGSGAFSRPGYKFTGWSLSKKPGANEVLYQADNKINITKDTTLYAQWEAKKAVNYKVEWYIPTEDNKYTQYGETQTRLAVPGHDVGVTEADKQISISGYTLDDTKNSEWNGTIPDGDKTLTLKLYYKADISKILFVENGGSDVSDMTGNTGYKINDTKMPVTERKGYDFIGWYDNADFTGESIKVLPDTYPMGETTFYANWEKQKHHVMIDYVTPKGETEIQDVDDLYEEGDDYYYATPSIPGYTSSIDIVQGEMGDKDVKVVVTYEPIQYQLTIYYMDSAGNTMAPTYQNKIAYKDSFKIVSPVIAGYAADYLSISSGENGMPAVNLTFTVTYTPIIVVPPTTEEPTPEEPVPGNPTPEEPTPEEPTPGNPTPEEPTPGNPTPESPTPENPTPENPTPETPTPDAAPDTTPDTTPDAAPDTTPDAAPDTTPDATPDTTPDATPAVVPAAAAPIIVPVATAAPAPVVVIAPTQAPAAQINAEVTQNEDGDYTLTEVKDVDTPLANTNLDDHTCCILHFLLMLLALLVLCFYTRSMKKRQARIFKLDEKLRIEMVRRNLEEESQDVV